MPMKIKFKFHKTNEFKTSSKRPTQVELGQKYTLKAYYRGGLKTVARKPQSPVTDPHSKHTQQLR